MNENTLISVIIPAYNRGIDIATAVGSALQQDHQSMEILVVDDCSRDNTAAIVEEIKDSRVRLIRREKNGGASAARNTGIAAATGDLIAFLDSDDSWYPTKLRRNLEFLRQTGVTVESRWVAYSRIEIRNEFGSRASKVSPQGYSLAELIFCNHGMIQTSAIFLPAHLAKATLFAEDVAWVDDWEFLLRLERAGALLLFQDDVLAVHNAFSAAIRMSNRGDVEHLVRWIEGHRPHLSHREIAGFYATRVAPQLSLSGDRLGALRLLLTGAAAKAIEPRTLAVEIVRATVPRRLFGGLRSLLGRGKARRQ